MATMDLRSLSQEELTEQLTACGYPAFRAKQIRQWLDRGVTDFEQMTNLPKDLRDTLVERYTVPGVTIVRKLVSAIDGTVKYLFRLDDGETVESVLMQYKHGWSQCLSIPGPQHHQQCSEDVGIQQVYKFFYSFLFPF